MVVSKVLFHEFFAGIKRHLRQTKSFRAHFTSCILTTAKLHCVTALISFFRFVYNYFHQHAYSWWNKKYFHFFFYFSKTLFFDISLQDRKDITEALIFLNISYETRFFIFSLAPNIHFLQQIIKSYIYLTWHFSWKKKKNKSLALHFLLKIQIICHCY